ncbi:MAG TPA: ISAs1 family transposase [Ktedonobacterales bacterium]
MAPRLVARVRPLLRGRVVSGDALYCQKALCRRIHKAGGDYLFAVKANQPGLREDVSLLFCDPPPGEAFRQTHTVDAHGGRVEQRWLRASTALAGYLREAGWVGAGQVLEVRTSVRWPAYPQRPSPQELRYFLSSLPAQVSAHRALELVRQHWHIENRLHWPRDVTLGADASQVRFGHAPQALSAVRNVVVGVLHLYHAANLAAAQRIHAWSPPARVLSLLGLTPEKL